MDFMNWEMCIPTQDSTRVSSLSLLFQLFTNYKRQIRKGYVMLAVKKGFVLINPGTLNEKHSYRQVFIILYI